mgnify:CR=1 FL=1
MFKKKSNNKPLPKGPARTFLNAFAAKMDPNASFSNAAVDKNMYDTADPPPKSPKKKSSKKKSSPKK